MNAFEWTPEDLVFLPQIDADHQKLIRDIEELRKALTSDSAATKLRYRSWQLTKSLSVHFEHEERLMRRSRYPGQLWHQSQHLAGRSKMGRLVAAIQGQELGAIPAALQELGQWFKDHVGLADRMLGAHIRNDGRERLVS